MLSDLGWSEAAVALVAPWFFALQLRTLELARAQSRRAGVGSDRHGRAYRTLRQPRRIQDRDSTRGSSRSTASWPSSSSSSLCGLAYQQIYKGALHHEQERQQNERRVITPGPARQHLRPATAGSWSATGPVRGRPLPRRAAPEFRKRVHPGPQQLPRWPATRTCRPATQLERIAHVSVVQRYLDQVNSLLGRTGTVDGAGSSATSSASSSCPTRSSTT
jgi:hypothetical protein